MPVDIENRRRLSREWYQAHKDITKKRARAHNIKKITEIRDYVNRIKIENPCTDCGNFFHWICMDFDHLDATTKIGSVASMIGRFKSLDKVIVEISKCELVCANCHRLRTLRRFTEK